MLLITLGFYLTYATNLFKSEKAADIYLISMGNSTNLSDKLEITSDKYRGLIDTFLKNASNDTKSINQDIKKMTSIHQELLGISCFLQSGESAHYFPNLQLDQANTLNELNKSLLQKTPLGSMELKRINLPHLGNHILLSNKKDFLSCNFHLNLESLSYLSDKENQMESFILEAEGNIFYNISRRSSFDENIKNEYIKNLKSESGVFRIIVEQSPKIVAYAKIPSFNLYALTEIPEEKAFQASTLLIKKSIYFGVALLSFALIIGIIFSNTLTSALMYLSNAANTIAKGDFHTPINYKKSTNDEVGFLISTFENMREKIVAYMEEMKEKYRLENEVKVAQIVQSSFFPDHSYQENNVSFFGSYIPASECGGDWWGYLQQDEKVTLIICDATGHGVPAALLTAAAHSTISNLKLEAKKHYISPADILERLNQVVSLMNSSLQLTAFAFEVNSKTGAYKYANASHQPALIFSTNEQKTYSKDSITPLQGANSSRLGEQFHSTYQVIEGNLKPEDKVIFYTDGILEFTHQDKTFGQRNFFKYILESLNGNVVEAEALTIDFLEKFNNFRSGSPLQDDITFLALNFSTTKNESEMIEVQNVEDLEQLNSNLISKHSLFISQLDNQTNVSELLIKRKVRHLFGRNGISLTNELATLQKIHKQNLNFGEIIFQTFLESNDQISFATDSLVSEIEKKNLNKIDIPSIVFVVEELLSNAFYHSLANQNNSRSLSIKSSEFPIELRAEITETSFSLYVESPTPNPGIEAIIQSIHRGQIEKSPKKDPGGAGLGLYLIYEKAHQVWIINRENKLGFLIVFERFNRNIQAKERITSFHYIDMVNNN